MGWASGNRWYRQKITISGANVAGDVTDFPVAISIPSGNDVFTNADTSGTDIFFTEDDGETQLDFERSIWDKSGSEGIFYVKTDLLSASDNEIYMYYGGSILPDYEDAANVWDSNFDAVWHFEDGTYNGSANEVQDSSGNGNHGRRGNGNFQGFDSTWGQALNITDSDDWMRFESNLDIFTEYTISCLFWIPLSNSTSWHTLTRGSSYHQIILQNDHQLGNYQSGFHSCGFDMDSLSTGMHHVAVVRKTNGTGDFYVDGSYVGNAASQPQDDIYAVGNYQGNGQHFGQIDEFRVSNSTGRSATWLAVEAENLLNNSTFISDFAAREVSPYLISTSPHDTPTAVTVGEFEAIGGVRQILTEYTQGVSSTIYYDMPVYYALADVVSGTRDVDNEFYVATTGTLSPTHFNTDVDYFTGSTGSLLPGVKNVRDDFVIGRYSEGYTKQDVYVQFIQGKLLTPSGFGLDIEANFVQGAANDAYLDDDVEFTVSTSNLHSGDGPYTPDDFLYVADCYSSTYSGTAVAVPPEITYSDWLYRREIVVDASKVAANLTDFTMAVEISGPNSIFTNARADGYDIFFTTSDGVTKLPHELARYNAGTEELLAFVKCNLTTGGDLFYIYYGHPTASDQSDVTNTWDSDFYAVYHFEEGSGNLLDSTTNNNDGTVSGPTRNHAGVLGRSYYFDGNNDYVQVYTGNVNPDRIPGDRTHTYEELTVALYCRPGAQNGHGMFCVTEGVLGAGGDDRHIYFDGSGNVIHRLYGAETLDTNDQDWADDNWHQIAIAYGQGTGKNHKIIVDGQTRVTGLANEYSDFDWNNYYYIGFSSPDPIYDYFLGYMTEVRISRIYRSVDWLSTEYENIINNSDFFTLGAEESGVNWELDDYIDVETTISGGSLWPFPADVYSSASGTWQPLDIDIYVSLCNTVPSGQVYKSPEVWPVASGYYFGGEITTSGALTGYEQDIYVSLESLISGSNDNTYRTDMRLHAMEIDNFFLEVDEYTTSAGVMTVDVYDKRRIPLSTSGTYFVVSGTQVPTVLSGIEVPTTDLGQPIVASGYRMFFDSPSDFFADEPLEIVAHGENIIGDVIEQTYYLLYGYNLIYDTPPEVVWGWGDQIIVWATAKNKASCPAQSTDGWWFEIRPKQHADLGATIVPTGYANLPATIYPQLQPKSFFYGAKVQVIVRAKDEAGNEMEPFVLNFTIEDNPN